MPYGSRSGRFRAENFTLSIQDVIAQAKSGTGKTLVFAITALEHVLKARRRALSDEEPHTRVLILAPTREVSYRKLFRR